jgi:hypothetical protein
VRLVEEIRFASLGVDVGVGAEEGREAAGLVPPDEKVDLGIAEEPADVSCT